MAPAVPVGLLAEWSAQVCASDHHHCHPAGNVRHRIHAGRVRDAGWLRTGVTAPRGRRRAGPTGDTALVDRHRLTDQIEQLPVNLAAERQATLASFEDAMVRADPTITNVGAMLDDARTLIASLRPTGESIDGMFQSADTLFGRFDAWNQTDADTPSHPYDIREHTEAAKELAIAAERMNEMLMTSNQLLGSPHWDDRLQVLNESADGRMEVAADQSRGVLNAIFWRVCALLGVLFAMLVLYRVISLMLSNRLHTAGAHTQGHELASSTRRVEHGRPAPDPDHDPSSGNRDVYPMMDANRTDQSNVPECPTPETPVSRGVHGGRVP